MGKMRNAFRILTRKPEEETPLKRPRHKWENNIEMDLKERECKNSKSIVTKPSSF
jgi:hypothetical protein